MRRRAPRPLALALAALTARLEPATPLGRVQGAWSAVVGEAIAAHCTPTAERRGALEVRCDEAVWAAEVELMAPELIERLTGALDGLEITSLRCRADRS